MSGKRQTSPARPDLTVDVSVEAGDWPPASELRKLADEAIGAATAALDAAGPASESRSSGPEKELSLLFTDDASIRRLNRAWRGKDAATNVLSFPQSSGPLLGDVILAAETVRREAALAGKPLEDHIVHLVVHGFLHLLGHDHEQDDDAEKMEELERVALKRLGIPDPYAHPQDP
jgi:probable rRNA maturation factor